MLYALIGFFKGDVKPVPQSVLVLTTDFLGQPFTKIRMAGQLCDPPGKRAGMMMIFEDESREAAEIFVNESPYLQAGLLEDHRLYEYLNEIG